MLTVACGSALCRGGMQHSTARGNELLFSLVPFAAASCRATCAHPPSGDLQRVAKELHRDGLITLMGRELVERCAQYEERVLQGIFVSRTARDSCRSCRPSSFSRPSLYLPFSTWSERLCMASVQNKSAYTNTHKHTTQVSSVGPACAYLQGSDR